MNIYPTVYARDEATAPRITVSNIDIMRELLEISARIKPRIINARPVDNIEITKSAEYET